MLALLDLRTSELAVLAVPDVLRSSRGITGLAASDRFVFAAAPIVESPAGRGSPQPSSLFVFDREDLALRGRYVFERGIDVHSLWLEEARLWAVSTGTDEVLELVLDGPEVVSETVAWRPEPDGPREDRHHLNAIRRFDGRLLVAGFGPKSGEAWSSANDGFVHDVERGRRIAAGIDQPHSFAAVDGRLVVCESRGMTVRALDGPPSQRLPGYTRGLCADDGSLLVGVSTGRVVSKSADLVGNPSDPGEAAGSCSIARLSGDAWDPEAIVDAAALGREIYDLLPVDGVGSWPVVPEAEWRRETLEALWNAFDATSARARRAERVGADRKASAAKARRELERERARADTAAGELAALRQLGEEQREELARLGNRIEALSRSQGLGSPSDAGR